MRDKIRTFIFENFLFGRVDDPLSDDDSFLENGIIDSTGVLELVAFIEETFGIKVDDEDLIPDNLDSVNSLLNFLERKTATSSTETHLSQ